MKVPIEIIVWTLGIIFSLISGGVILLVRVVSKNTASFDNLVIIVTEIQTSRKFENNECATRHKYVDDKIKLHDSKLEAHAIVITEHEVKIKEFKKK